jgi:hypothetical protein
MAKSVRVRARRQAGPDSAIVWEGPSRIDGAPIVAIITGIRRPSKNSKTGPMAQVWILRADMSPLEAIARGLDGSICGGCAFRAQPQISMGAVEWADRACYVDVGKAPMAIYKKYARGGYARMDPALISTYLVGRTCRLGAYGDPYAVPIVVWQALVAFARRHTGYTHQWRRPDAIAYQGLIMASADCERDHVEARAQGWRTFRVLPEGGSAAPLAGEISCPASAEMGYRTTCHACGLCNGAAAGRAGVKSIAILAHGPGKANVISLESLRRGYATATV